MLWVKHALARYRWPVVSAPLSFSMIHLPHLNLFLFFPPSESIMYTDSNSDYPILFYLTYSLCRKIYFHILINSTRWGQLESCNKIKRFDLMFACSRRSLRASWSSLTWSHVLFCIMVHYPHSEGKIDYRRNGRASALYWPQNYAERKEEGIR